MRRESWLPWILVAIGPLLLFGPMILRGEVLFWGTPMLQFVPWRLLGFELLKQGSLPLWNPLVGMGAPLLANYQSAFLYPPNWLLGIIGVEWGQAFLAAFHLIWAGWGMVALSRRLGFSTLGQTVSAIAFSLSGYLVARAWFISIDSSAAWLPWVIWAMEGLIIQIIGSKGRKAIGKATLVLALLLSLQWLAGHAQMAWYSLLAALIWAGWRWISLVGWREISKPLVPILISLGIAFGISALQIVPTLEYLWQSQRAGGLAIDFAMTYSFWPWRLAGLFLPDLFGNPAHGDYWGYGNYWEDAIYIGIAAVIVALAAGYWSLRGRGDDPMLGRFLLVLSGIAFLFAMGDNTPIFPFLFKYIPTFGLFQAPTRWNLWLVFSLSLLAGLGVQGWKTPSDRGLYWARLGTAGAAAIAIAAWGAMRWIPDLEGTFVRAFAIASVLLVTFGLLTLFARKDRSFSIILVLGFFLVVDLVFAGWGLNPSTRPELYVGASDFRNKVETNHRVYVSTEAEQQLKFDEFFRFDTFYAVDDWRDVRSVGLPNTSMMDRIATANNFDPLVPGRYTDWFEAFESASAPIRDRTLALMDVAYFLDRAQANPEYRPIENPTRLRLYDRVLAVRDADEALLLVMSESFNIEQDLIIETPDEITPIGGDAMIRSWTQKDPDSITVEIQSAEGTWLLISEAWYPGWRVRIDGRDSELYHADHLFMGVWIEPGDHLVEFSYEPLNIRIGLLITLLTLLGTLGVYFRWLRE